MRLDPLLWDMSVWQGVAMQACTGRGIQRGRKQPQANPQMAVRPLGGGVPAGRIKVEQGGPIWNFRKSVDTPSVRDWGHGLPKVSPGPAVPYPSRPLKRLFQGWPANRAVGLWLSSTLLDTPHFTSMLWEPSSSIEILIMSRPSNHMTRPWSSQIFTTPWGLHDLWYQIIENQLNTMINAATWSPPPRQGHLRRDMVISSPAKKMGRVDQS
jgi:hypothetical protein